MGAHHSGIEHLHQMRGLAHPGKRIEEGFEGSGLAQSPEPFPHTVPGPELAWKRAPCDVVDRKILQCFEKLAIVPALVAAPRARRPEYLQDDRPVGFRHGREHGRSSSNRPPMSHRKTDLGIPPRYTRSNPSTRPKRNLKTTCGSGSISDTRQPRRARRRDGLNGTAMPAPEDRP